MNLHVISRLVRLARLVRLGRFAPLVGLWVTASCVSQDKPADFGAKGRVAIDVAALSLAGVVDADYTVMVTNATNGTGETVWSRDLSSSAFGDSAGSVTYVGPCDASGGANSVTITLNDLYDASGTIDPATYQNPTPITRDVACVENADNAVTFNMTILRDAKQGFFDVAVSFDDIFCSAKLDCERGGQDLNFLHNPTSGEREMTSILGFACAGSTTGETYLYMDDLVIECDGLPLDTRVDPTGLGIVDFSVAPNANDGAYLFGASIFRGVEDDGSAFWNVALGLNESRFSVAQTCTLRARGTASELPFPQEVSGFPLPAAEVYPVIEWNVPLSTAGGRACGTHAVNVTDSGVATVYTGYLPAINQFVWQTETVFMAAEYNPDSGIARRGAAAVCNPGCVTGNCVATDVCDCAGTGYSGTLCDAPICTSPCANGGVCAAPETCDCSGTGFDGATCASDIDECATNNGGCAQTCVNAAGSSSCTCGGGYTLNGDGVSCDDIDECAAGTHGCDGNAACTNTVGGNTCACVGGYYGDGASCTICPGIASCTGDVTCSSASDSVCSQCAAGYVLANGGQACADIDECATNNGGCAQGCVNAAGSSSCTCGGGYTLNGDGVSCDDIDECAAGTDGCDGNAACTNTVGGNTCACVGGYYGDGASCTICSAIASCTGDVTCSSPSDSVCSQCAAGYAQLSAGAACTDINECGDALDDCSANGSCTNTAGGFDCACNTGFYGDGVLCTECSQIAGCTSLETCNDASDSACATCGSGLEQLAPGAACADIDGCAGEPCGGVTCYDTAAPGTGYTCAVPDATSTLTCVPSTLVSGDATTCTIVPRQGGAVISAAASAFAPVADSGQVGALSPSVGASITFTFTSQYAGDITVGDALASAVVAVTHGTSAGSTPALAGFDCQDLLNQGIITSGTYWVDPSGSDPVQTYCEQQAYGGGWSMVFNSVGDPGGATRAFWVINYDDRMAHKGTASLSTNFYGPTLYRDGRDYLDVIVGLSGTEVEMMRATAGGITEATMAMVDPTLVSGNSGIFVSQFSGGWSSPDMDLDARATSNCAVAYGTTQHFDACWAYNLGSDADGGTNADGGWGPHIGTGYATSFGLSDDSVATGGIYTRVNRITRFTRMCTGPGCTAGTAGLSCATLQRAGVSKSGVYWIDPTGSAPFKAYCDMTTEGGGWAVLQNSVGDPNGQTTAFWQFPYAQRLVDKGTAGLGTNYYGPSLYSLGTQFMDVYEGMNRGQSVAFVASADGINTSTMRLVTPALVSSNGDGTSAYNCHFAGGWSSTDYDNDSAGSNCAASYSSVTQHYCACWNHNLGADADSPRLDGGWGPHLNASDTRFSLYSDGSNYSRVRRISRYARWYPASCLEWLDAGFDQTGTYTIDPDGGGPGAPFDAHCEMDYDGGGWTRVYYQDTSVGFFLETDTTLNKSNPDAGLYAILDDIEGLRRAGGFEFSLSWPGSAYTLPQQWFQTSNPVTTGAGSIPTGVVDININYRDHTDASGNWAGLQANAGAVGSKPSILDGTISPVSNWYYAIGTTACWVGPAPACQPGPTNATAMARAELWVR